MSTRDFLLKSNVIETEMFQRYPKELEQLLSAANIVPGVGGPDINFEKYLRMDDDLLDISEDRFLQILASKPDLVNSNNFAGLRFSIYKDYMKAAEYILTSPNLRPNENLRVLLNPAEEDPVSSHMKFTLFMFGQNYGATLNFETYFRLNEINRREYYHEADDGYGGVDTMDTIVDERDLLDISEDRLLQFLNLMPDLVNLDNFAALRFSILKDYTRAVEYILTSPTLRPNENLPLILNSVPTEQDRNYEYLNDIVSNNMNLTLYLFGQKYGATLSERELKAVIHMPVQEFMMVLHDYKKYFLNKINLENQSAEDTSRIKDYLLMSDPLYSSLLQSKLQYAYDMYTFFKVHRPDRVESMNQQKEDLDFLIREGADYTLIDKHGGYGFA